MFNELKDYSALDWTKLLIVIGLVLLIGLFAVNQFLDFRYKAEFLSNPCGLCLKLNDNIDLCPNIKNKNINNIDEINFNSFQAPV